MRAVAAVLAAWALGTLVSSQAFAQQYYGPESDDDGAGPSTFYNSRPGPSFDRPDFNGPGYRGDEDFEPNREEPIRRYYRDNQSGEWRPMSRQSWSGDDAPPYREFQDDRYRRDSREFRDDR